jgi:ketosteroid isomerase-like protein
MTSKTADPKQPEIIGPTYRPEGDALSGVERLLALEEIRTTKTRYCAAMDDHDWKTLRSLFTDDCVMNWPLPGHNIETIDQFVGFLAAAMPDHIQSRHHVHNLQAEFVSPTEAIVRWDHENWAWFGDGSRPHMQQWGQYREKYRKTKEGWKISYFSEQFLFNSPAPATRRRAGIGDPEV